MGGDSNPGLEVWEAWGERELVGRFVGMHFVGEGFLGETWGEGQRVIFDLRMYCTVGLGGFCMGPWGCVYQLLS